MEDIGDYIYFILLAVVALSGLFGKKKKEVTGAGKKKSVFDQIPKTWEEFEEMTDLPKPAQPSAGAETVSKTFSKPATETAPFGSAEAILSPEYETTGYESMSYDTATDISTLRAKKQVKESIFKTKTSAGELPVVTDNDESIRIFTSDLTDPEEAKNAFILSEIFNRKYQ